MVGKMMQWSQPKTERILLEVIGMMSCMELFSRRRYYTTIALPLSTKS